VSELAARISASSSGIVAIGKRAFWNQIDRSEPDAYAYTQTVMARNAAAADAQEGIDAFLTKREPRWSDA
jgi:enoyl-CoA hydratase/carnithine racemase